MDYELIKAHLDTLLCQVSASADSAGLELVAVHAAMAKDALHAPAQILVADPNALI